MSLAGHDNAAASRFRRILAGDIGGTYSRLAIYSHRPGGFRLERLETYSSPEHAGLTDVLENFFREDGRPVDAACFGVPAAIHSGTVFPLTNLHWLIDRDQVRQAVGTDQVTLINDVEASAVGICGLADDDAVCLQRGTVDPVGTRVILSVGTGLGVSALTPSGRTWATEAGHASFSPSCDLDLDLLARLQREHGHVSWERVASGSALPTIYSLLVRGQAPDLDAIQIVRRSGVDPACARVLEVLRRYIGSAAGNIALTLMAGGGLYVSGGLARRVLNQQNAGQFLEAFRDKGRMGCLLEQLPVYLVHENNLALRGAAQTAAMLLGSDLDHS